MRVLALLLLVSCDRSHEGKVAAAPEKSATAQQAKSTWPALESEPPPGATFRSFHHRTLHVRLALPAGAIADERILKYGDPGIVITSGDVRVDVFSSNGAAKWGASLARVPPSMGSMRVERIERDTDHVAVIVRRETGERVVNAWTRGAECYASAMRDDQLDGAFRICASLRTLPPGAWREAEPRFPPVPEGAYVSHDDGATQMAAGHFRGKVLEKPCPAEDEIRKEHAPREMKLATRAMKHGDVIVGREFVTYEGARYESGTTVWATRGARCCVAYIPEFFTPPTEDQVEDVARWCDLTPP